MSASPTIGEVIQLSLAPVFLLVAIASFLNVMTIRLGRVVDRARALEIHISEAPEDPRTSMELVELAALDKRMVHAQRAISFNAVAALLIAFLVALIFLSDLTGMNAAQPVAVLFILAMTAIIVGLYSFLMEIYVATQTLRVQAEFLKKP